MQPFCIVNCLVRRVEKVADFKRQKWLQKKPTK